MRKSYLIFGSFWLLPLTARMQPVDSSQYKVKRTAIRAVYNHYTQDGIHSAVTGGEGTEQLTVYAPAVSWSHESGRNRWELGMGVDVISSASTDNIDFRFSSASRIDRRVHIDLDYHRQSKDALSSWQLGTGLSAESDYLSLPLRAGFQQSSPNGMRQYELLLQAHIDDLRWGRFDEDLKRPATLVYPVELRSTNWHDKHMRYSYGLKMGASQVMDARNRLGLTLDLHYQHGLLSTPFHRIFFSDGSRAVETLPEQRLKAALALRWFRFIGGNWIIRQSAQAYTDDFGIQALTITHESVLKVNPAFSLIPQFRWHTQSASHFFALKGAHQVQQTFYTSDFDLSELKTWQLGLASRFYLQPKVRNKLRIQELAFSYAYYKRSDGLWAHILQASFLWEKSKKP